MTLRLRLHLHLFLQPDAAPGSVPWQPRCVLL